jgi:hypothetical protein
MGQCTGAKCKCDLTLILMATIPSGKASELVLTLSSFPLNAFWHFHS